MSEAPQNLPIPTGTLIEITDHLAALIETVDACTDPDLKRQCEADVQRYLEAEIRKVDAVRGYLVQCEAQEGLAKEEAARLSAEAATWARRRCRVEDYVMAVMQRLGEKTLKGRTGKFSLRSCPPSVVITDESQIPERFIQIETVKKIKRTEIKAAIQANEDVPGADLQIDKKTLSY